MALTQTSWFQTLALITGDLNLGKLQNLQCLSFHVCKTGMVIIASILRVLRTAGVRYVYSITVAPSTQ